MKSYKWKTIAESDLSKHDYYKHGFPKTVSLLAGIIGVAFAIYTCCKVPVYWEQKDLEGVLKLAAAWLILPPIFFFLEYHFLFRSSCFGRHTKLDEFKYGQQVSISIWAGIALLMFAIANSSHFKQSKQTEIFQYSQSTANDWCDKSEDLKTLDQDQEKGINNDGD